MRTASAFLGVVATVVLSVGNAQDTPDARANRAFVETLQARGVLTRDEVAAVSSATQLNPRLMDAALERAGAASNPEGFVSSATVNQLREIRQDLLNRAKLQAIASGTVPIDPDVESRLRPFFSRTASADLPTIALPAGLDRQAMQSLSLGIRVVRPVCPNGTRPAGADSAVCIPGDPWSEALFRSVVPIVVDGKRVCTGSALGDGLILTAAHCVIEQVNGRMAVMNRSRIAVTNRQGTSLAISTDPRVPGEMMWACLPRCADRDYDFAILSVTPSQDADWTPLPIVSAITGTGDLAITIAGYGITTMPSGASKSGLYIGAQRVTLSAVDQALEWRYSISGSTGSSNCPGDSGGPIFQGNPRKDGDGLALIGVMSGLGTPDCFQAVARAVNFSQPGPRTKLCGFLTGRGSLCAGT